MTMQRFYFTLSRTDQWYAIMRECRAWFGKDWRCQPKVRRKLSTGAFGRRPCQVWFDVPDERFASWVAVKLAVEVVSESRMQANK